MSYIPNIYEVPFTDVDIEHMDDVMQRIVDMGAEFAVVVDYHGSVVSSGERVSSAGMPLMLGDGRFQAAPESTSRLGQSSCASLSIWQRHFEYVAVGVATYVDLSARALDELADEVNMIFERYRAPYGYHRPRPRRRS